MSRKQLLISAIGLAICCLALVAPKLTASAAPVMVAAPAIAPHAVPIAAMQPQATTNDNVIQGVNTAGTVRVNYLAKLEAALDIGSNVTEVVGILLGLYYLIKTPMTDGLTPGKKTRGYVTGVALILMGLAAPGVVNYFVNFGNGCGSLF